MEVSAGVPEQGLVSISPEVVLDTNVLEFHILGTLVLRNSQLVSTVLSVLLLNVVRVDSSENKSGNKHKDGNLLPQLSSSLGMLLGVGVVVVELTSGLSVRRIVRHSSVGKLLINLSFIPVSVAGRGFLVREGLGGSSYSLLVASDGILGHGGVGTGESLGHHWSSGTSNSSQHY